MENGRWRSYGMPSGHIASYAGFAEQNKHTEYASRDLRWIYDSILQKQLPITCLRRSPPVHQVSP
jgi:hypothetical protein